MNRRSSPPPRCDPTAITTASTLSPVLVPCDVLVHSAPPSMSGEGYASPRPPRKSHLRGGLCASGAGTLDVFAASLGRRIRASDPPTIDARGADHRWPSPRKSTSRSSPRATASTGRTPRTPSSSPSEGLNERVVEEISALKGEPDWMRKYRLKSLRYFDMRPMPWWGADLSRDRLPEHLLLHPLDREAGRELGRAARRHPGHLGQARHPRGRAEVPRRRERAVRERGRLPQDQGRARRDRRAVHRHGHARCATTPTSCASTSAR